MSSGLKIQVQKTGLYMLATSVSTVRPLYATLGHLEGVYQCTQPRRCLSSVLNLGKITPVLRTVFSGKGLLVVFFLDRLR